MRTKAILKNHKKIYGKAKKSSRMGAKSVKVPISAMKNTTSIEISDDEGETKTIE
jgi:hypothetical protein